MQLCACFCTSHWLLSWFLFNSCPPLDRSLFYLHFIVVGLVRVLHLEVNTTGLCLKVVPSGLRGTNRREPNLSVTELRRLSLYKLLSCPSPVRLLRVTVNDSGQTRRKCTGMEITTETAVGNAGHRSSSSCVASWQHPGVTKLFAMRTEGMRKKEQRKSLPRCKKALPWKSCSRTKVD